MRWNVLLLLILMIALAAFSPSHALPTQVFIYAIAALGFNVLYGTAGLLSFGQSVFFGGAAYVCALLLISFQFSAIIITFIGGAFGLVVAVLFSLLSLRTKGIYFVMLTLVLGVVGYFLALTFKNYTGGENGLSDVPRPNITFFNHLIFDLQSPLAMMLYCAAFLILFFLLVELLSRSPLGSVLTAYKLNEQRAEILGYDTKYFRMVAFSISGFMTGVAGALYAIFLRFVPLNSLDFETSEKIVIMTLIGGVGTTLGPVVGATLFFLAEHILAPIWPRWMMLMGILIILIIVIFKGGIFDLLQKVISKYLFSGLPKNILPK